MKTWSCPISSQYLTIDARHRRNPRFLASIQDFTVSPGETVSSDVILNNPNISLYCFDDDKQQAIFTELPDGIDLATVPFVYLKQHESAQRLIAVPYDDFHRIARTLPPIEHLILIYISGRSGSTLLSHIFNAVDDVVSLSEPDVITQIAHLRAKDDTRDAGLQKLADSAVRLLFRLNPDKVCAIKVRPQALRVMDLFQKTFSGVKNLYSYRDIVGYVSSFYRIITRFDTRQSFLRDEAIGYYGEQFDYDLTPYITRLIPGTDDISLVQLLTLQWIICMEWYLAQAEHGIPVLPIRYKDLKTADDTFLTGIFEHCGLPVEQVANTLHVFERDSQAGSPIARTNPKKGNMLKLNDEQIQQIKHILQGHAVIKTTDYTIPGTLKR